MADFCYACCWAMFGQDTGDLAGITTENDTRQGLVSSHICEDCGEVVQVDHAGIRVPYSPQNGWLLPLFMAGSDVY